MSLNNLCEEVIVEIFSRVPPKSVLQFRSVSKSLCARIDSPGFIRLHAIRSPPTKFIIMHRVLNEENDKKRVYTIHSESQMSSYIGITPVEYPLDCYNSSIIGSCNGILCLYQNKIGVIHLWNPTVRRKIIVRDLPSTDPCLAHGFGFDPIINDYKIVSASKRGTFVYTMKTRSWREIASPATPFSFVESSQCVFNGVLHWVVEMFTEQNFRRLYILTFDLSSEVFSTIELPEPTWETSEVTIIKGCLAVISLENFVEDHTWIWVRNTVDESWSVRERNTYEMTTKNNLLFTHHSKGIEVYNPETKVRWRLMRLPYNSSIDQMITCNESLELLDIGTRCDQTIRRKKEIGESSTQVS